MTAIFLNIVLDKEAVLICENKIQMLQEQEEFISPKVQHKAATEGDLLNIQADITNARVELAEATLGKEVRQAIINANAAYDKYTLLAADVDKYVEALRHTKEKYDAGAATYYDYSTAVSNLFQARGKRLQSKYEYMLRTKIIEFYAGEE